MNLLTPAVYLVFLLSLLPGSAYSLERISSNSPLLSQSMVLSVEILGLERTDRSVVTRELLLIDDILDSSDLSDALQNLKNLRIFSEVNSEVKANADNDLTLHLQLEEKWTTIPVLKYSSGGGTNYFVVGAYDINTFGRYLELGAQYENWNGQNAGVVWFRDPRFLNQRTKLSADLWSVKRPGNLYDASGNDLGQFVLDRKKFNLGLEKEFALWFKLGIGVEINEDRFLDSKVPEDANHLFADDLLAGDESNAVITKYIIGLGKLDYDNYLVRGNYLEVVLDRAIRVANAEHNFSRVNIDLKSFWYLPFKTNLAMHFLSGATNSDALQHVYAIGGFENIRGYYDGQFRGRAFWQANLELRIPSVYTQWFVLQHNFFIDSAQVKQTVSELSVNGSDTYASAGLGIRINSPKIYRFTARLDYVAWASKTGGSVLAFGVQQFF